MREGAIGGDSFIVKAYAGTGKSASLNLIANALPKARILYVTFGKENVKEAVKKFPKNVVCATAHSLAYRHIDKQIGLYRNGLVKPSISLADFNQALGIEPTPGDFESHIKHSTIALNAILQFCRAPERRLQGCHVPEPDDGPQINFEDKHIALGLAKEYWGMVINGNAYLTHDMYLKMWQIEKPKLGYDLILFDEAQDADRLMVDVVNEQDCQKFIVGDDHQQIYSFRGAVNALNIFDIERRASLTQSFRYGPQVAELANELLYQHKRVRTKIKGNPALPTNISTRTGAHSVIIGRTVASLFDMIVEQRQSGDSNYTCLFDTREMSSVIYAILTLIGNSKNPHRKPKPIYHPFIAGFDTYNEFLLYTKYAQGTNIATYQNIVSKHTLEQVNGVLDDIKNNSRKRSKNRTKYMTAHKCKGLEFDDVTLLDDFTEFGHKDWNVEETNLAYVAATRAQKNLCIAQCGVLLNVYDKKSRIKTGT